jgi:hypothetical protein
MKNFKLLMIFIVALGLAATSCSKDDEETTPVNVTPTINFKGGTGYISEDATVTAGENFTIGITANSNGNSGEKLQSVRYTVTSNNQIILEQDSVFNETSYSWDYTFSLSSAGEAVFMFEVTDKDGEKNNVSLTITAEPATTPLGDATDFTWTREGGNDGTGVEAFGLKWTKNLKVVSAVIEKDAATKMVQLSADAWTMYTTMEDLMAAVDAAEDMADYRGVSVEANGTYDDVLGVIYNGEYYMIHVSSATVETGTAGTTVNIYGQSKK